MINLNGQNSIAPGIIIPLSVSDEMKLKLPHDAFNIYVNGEFIGNKALITQGDGGINSVKDYLNENILSDFEYRVDGNNINIITNKNDIENIKNHLKIYLNIR